MGEGRGRGRECMGREQKENVWNGGTRNARKNTQNATDLAFGDAPWGLPSGSYIFMKALFRDNISVA